MSCFVSHLVIVDTTQAVQRSPCVDFGTVGVSFVSALPCREHIVTNPEGGCQFVFFVFSFFFFPFCRWRVRKISVGVLSNAHANRADVTATSVVS